MSIAFKYQTEVSIINCCVCGGPIALANEDNLRRTHTQFYCPMGHVQSFTGETDADKYKKQLERETQRREMAEREVAAERKRAEQAEKKLARDRQRVSRGVCPCCNRFFANLHRHMATKHPDVAADNPNIAPETK